MLFIFDSWAYENDTLRIDFLLEFINKIKDFLKSKDENANISWYKEQEDIISGKEKIERKSQEKIYSKIGLLVVLSFAIAAFGSKIIEYLIQDSIRNEIKTVFQYDVKIFAYFLCVPIMYYLFV